MIAKMLRHTLLLGYRRSEAPRRPTLGGYVDIIDEILRADKALIKKDRHTTKRIFERLRPSWLVCFANRLPGNG